MDQVGVTTFSSWDWKQIQKGQYKFNLIDLLILN